MLAENYQVVDVLMLVGNVAPIAVYFLLLGLVNSHFRPYLTTSRSDFMALTIALFPVLLWPLPAIVTSGLSWVLIIALIVAAGFFLWMVPRRGAGFVVYNLDSALAGRLIEECVASLGWSGDWKNSTWRARDGSLVLHVRKFPLLRNLTLHVEGPDEASERKVGALIERLQHRHPSRKPCPAMRCSMR